MNSNCFVSGEKRREEAMDYVIVEKVHNILHVLGLGTAADNAERGQRAQLRRYLTSD